MHAADDMGRACGKTLLVLDAVTGGDAERLYERLGWQRVGVIPRYALFSRGGLCATTVFIATSALRPYAKTVHPSGLGGRRSLGVVGPGAGDRSSGS